MQTVRLETRIAAPATRSFLLSLNIDLQMDVTARTRERAIAGVTGGLIGPDECVTWEGRYLGLLVHHTSKIVAYEPPTFFCDAMMKGIFKSYRHEHHFVESTDGTIMLDVLEFAAPFEWLGRIAEKVVLRKYLEAFLIERNAMIKRVAESDQWQKYLAEDAV